MDFLTPPSRARVVSECCSSSLFVMKLHFCHKISHFPYDMYVKHMHRDTSWDILVHSVTLFMYNNSGMVMQIRKSLLNLHWHHVNSRISEMFICFISHTQFYSVFHLYTFKTF